MVYTVLVVEDDRFLRQCVMTLLTLEGFHVLGAMNGQQGMDLAQSYHPHVILSDIFMSNGDGFALLRALKGEPTTAPIPVIGLSAQDSPSFLKRLEELGTSDFLVKPFTRNELLRAIGRQLSCLLSKPS